MLAVEIVVVALSAGAGAVTGAVLVDLVRRARRASPPKTAQSPVTSKAVAPVHDLDALRHRIVEPDAQHDPHFRRAQCLSRTLVRLRGEGVELDEPTKEALRREIEGRIS